jgi:hypothetical protein
MLAGDDYFVCNLPYQLSAYHGILTKKRIQDILSDENMSEISFMMEFEALFYSDKDTSYFKSSDILPCRTLEYAWYPPTAEEYYRNKNKEKKSYHLKKLNDKELRVVSCDIALMNSKNGHDNDNAVFTFIRSIPKNQNYISQVLWQETYDGCTAKQLALNIKRLYFDTQSDYIVLDTAGNGISVLDELGEYTTDVERGIVYPPLKAMNDEKYEERCGYSEAQKTIFCVNGSSKFNHEIAVTLKTAFQNKTIRLLKTQFEADDFIEGYHKMSPKEQADKLMPYVQTSLMQDEITQLEYEIKDSYIKLYETTGKRKDRYSSLAYGNYFIREREKKLKKKKKGGLANLW